MILACLIFPVVPLVYAAVLTMLVMRLFKNIRNKDFLSYLGFAASLIFCDRHQRIFAQYRKF